jgi:DNA gyrase inhibitor GyrI
VVITGAPVACEFGVEVTRAFESVGEVYATETPAGEAALAVHRGPYNSLNEAYDAIDQWMAANRRESAGLGCVNDLGRFLGLLIKQRSLLGGGR